MTLSTAQLRVVVYGARHAATTTFARLMFDMHKVDDELLFFEPDHPKAWTEWPDFENPITPSDLTELLHCNASAWGGWRRFTQDSRWRPPHVPHEYCRKAAPYSHCSTSWRPCHSAAACSHFKSQCREEKRVVAIKSIELQALLAKHGLPGPLQTDGLVLVHVVRDARGVFTSWFKDELGSHMILGANASTIVADPKYTPGPAALERFSRTVHVTCALCMHKELDSARDHPTLREARL